MKRTFDILMSLLSFILLLPLLIVISIFILIDLGRPVFFKQKRIGKDEKVINLIKFRSMTNERDNDGKLLPNNKRVTRLGKVLRRYSLDELPSLMNIIKGELSIVGPRPLLVDYLPYYKDCHKIRHTVKPGLTGLAQINGRNLTSWNERLDFDAEYVKKSDFLFDLSIIFKTVFKVIKSEGVEGNHDISIVRLDKDSSYLGVDHD